MKFRTEIERPKSPIFKITHTQQLLLLGSCFTENVGRELQTDGFDVVFNPMGPLYNPASLLRCILLATGAEQPLMVEYRKDPKMYPWHCLDFASKYCGMTENEVETTVKNELTELRKRIYNAQVVTITLGTAFVYKYKGQTVGNCHKLPQSMFTREMMSVDEVAECLEKIVQQLSHIPHIIFTVSPIRHISDTLHGNTLSKAVLQLAINRVVDNNQVTYFPSYEVMIDDLRDYRFYASDMKHPGESGIEYIYEVFKDYYFDTATRANCRLERKKSLATRHRQIID